MGTSQDTERNRPSKWYSLPGGHRGRDKSGYGRKPTERRVLTPWRQHRERQVSTWKETDRARVLTPWRPQREGQGRTEPKRVKNHRIRDKEGKTDPKLVATFLQLQGKIQTMILQLTQSDGKAIMHVFITASVLPFPCPKSRWVLEWDYIHLVLVMLCTITYRAVACFMLRFRLSLCTATSMRETAPPLSALAVISMRPSHRCPCFCISAGWPSIQQAFIS